MTSKDLNIYIIQALLDFYNDKVSLIKALKNKD